MVFFKSKTKNFKKFVFWEDLERKIKGQIYPTTSSVIPIYPVGRQSEGSPT